MENQKSEWIGDNVINILVATDNHLGYCENDNIRGNDSFVAFKEILELAVEKNVDFILLGGDLFHYPKPSNNSLFKCFELLRQYTHGDCKKKSLEFRDATSQALQIALNQCDCKKNSLVCKNATSQALQNALNQCVKIKDKKTKVCIPVFSISGNHDQGSEKMNPLNCLEITGLVNYFGCVPKQNKVGIKPVVLQKGETQLALYGLSYIPDSELNKAFEKKEVNITPLDSSTGEYFNIMVLHQNRFNRKSTGKDYIPEDILPDFLDLVIWGHEHTCRIEPENVNERRYKITQPGSSVATRMSKGEDKEKKVAFLQVRGKEFQIIPYRLRTVRPYIYDSLHLKKLCGTSTDNATGKVEELVKNKIEETIVSARKLLTNHPDQPTLPLLRLQIKYDNESDVFNKIRFGREYNGRVANPTELLIFKKPRKTNKTVENDVSDSSDGDEEMNDGMELDNYISQYFKCEEADRKLKTFKLNELNDMRKLFQDGNDNGVNEKIDSHLKDLISKRNEPNSNGI